MCGEDEGEVVCLTLEVDVNLCDVLPSYGRDELTHSEDDRGVDDEQRRERRRRRRQSQHDNEGH
jgi:hypothetical protein